MATAGTNITALAKPAVGVTVGPTWATDLNTSIDAVDNHDHSTNKGVRITPAAINVNADMEFNQNSASELKNVIFDSSVTAATTSYSVYQSGGNLYWRNGAGTAVQITTGSTVNAGAGSIDGMTGTDAGATYVDGAKAFNFFCDSGNTDFGKMAHADLLLYKFSDDNTADTDYITLAASALASGSSGTVTVPAETGTILTTNTSFAGAVINVATSASNYAINLKPHGTGHVVIGNGSATGKLTSNGAYDLILDTNSGTNSSSIAITDAANGDIKFIPNGTGKILVGSGSAAGVVTSSGAHDITVSTNSGTNSSYITITDAANGNINLVNNGTGEVVIGSGAAAGKITSSGAHDLVLDTNAGTNSSSITITDAANGDISFTPNGTGKILVGSGSAAGVVTSSGANDITVSTNSGTNSSYITITDAANGNISLVNNGTGEVVIGSGAAAGKITSSGAHDLVLDTNAGTNSGSITITDAADGAISLATNGNGNIALTTNGTGEVVVGSGSASGKITSSGANDLVLDTNAGSSSGSITITDAANGDITIACNGTGDIECSSDVKTSTSKKVYSKGNCIQTSFHSSLIFGF